MAPELAYVTARYAALAPFGKVAELLSVSGAPNAGTVRNRSMPVGEAVVQPNVTTTAKLNAGKRFRHNWNSRSSSNLSCRISPSGAAVRHRS